MTLAHDLLGSSLAAYLGYTITSGLRYFVVAGIIYWLLYLRFRDRFIANHIQEEFPSNDEVAYQIRWSLATILATGLFSLLLYMLVSWGWTRMYFDVAERGWPYFFFSILIGIAGYDAFIYWQHRLLHMPWWYENIHYIHHRAENPTPFALFTFHPIEHFMGNAYYVLFVMLVPVQPIAFGAVLVFFLIFGVLAHSGYEFFPAGFTRHRLLGWVNTSTHHNMHHTHDGCNYGNWFNLWDRLMGTNHPGYHEHFDAIKARVQPAPTQPAL